MINDVEHVEHVEQEMKATEAELQKAKTLLQDVQTEMDTEMDTALEREVIPTGKHSLCYVAPTGNSSPAELTILKIEGIGPAENC